MENKSVFEVLNSVNVKSHVEKKNGLSYLPWAWAWSEVKKRYPQANYTIYERDTEYGPVNYFTDGMTAWVKTGVIIDGLEHIEELPVMDFKNKSIPLGNITSFDVNKAIQRSLTKALGRHGLGLYIYAGEDLPEDERAGDTKKQLEQSVIKVAKLQTEMNQLDIDWRGELDTSVKDWIISKSGVENQDIGALHDAGDANKLIKCYQALIKKAKANVQKQAS